MPCGRQTLVASRALARVTALSLSAAATLSVGQAAQAADATEFGAGDRFNLALGQVVFRKQWVSAPSSTTSSDGLGPLYNARACAQCHPQGGRGQPEPDGARGLPTALVLRLSVPPATADERVLLATRRANLLAEPTYGVQLQPFAIQGHRSEGRLEVSYEERAVTLGDGSIVRLRKPSYRVTDLHYGPLRQDAMTSPRVAPPLIGLGLLEMVPEEQILGREGAAAMGGGVHGVPNRVWSLERGRIVLGRFGWKAGVPTVRQQVAEAFAIDLGLSSSLVAQPAGDCTVQEPECRNAPDGRSARDGGQEVADALLDRVNLYAAFADVPAAPAPATGIVRDGEALFRSIGCPACHRPSFVTGTTMGPVHLRGRLIRPYTDLLLHDMGEELADGRPEGLADGRMWRTPPLWGVGRPQTPAGRQTFLHDGRARSLDEAVLWHGGEARPARDAFSRLTAEERRALIAFLKSL
jgi:CxxC motif-containing protein (DUF1111 family)